mmetsp:Transcript_81357/g.230545  ORF Transcript_81357/g.230545 Transcript_81357/m.230545 type:complete len:212 (+) Transcript_81357:869-1504(+)
MRLCVLAKTSRIITLTGSSALELKFECWSMSFGRFSFAKFDTSCPFFPCPSKTAYIAFCSVLSTNHESWLGLSGLRPFRHVKPIPHSSGSKSAPNFWTLLGANGDFFSSSVFDAMLMRRSPPAIPAASMASRMPRSFSSAIRPRSSSVTSASVSGPSPPGLLTLRRRRPTVGGTWPLLAADVPHPMAAVTSFPRQGQVLPGGLVRLGTSIT